MKKSRLEIKAEQSKPPLFKRVNDYAFKLTGYIIDGIPIDKNVAADNKLVYGRF
jgi:hypothetical protein